MGKNRIRLQVDFEASTRSNESSISVGSGAVGGLDTRAFSSIVELGEGETLAVAGLVQTNYSAGSARIPFFGDLPVIGFLFGTNSTSHGEQELLILVTPEIVYPMKPNEIGPLPGTGMYEPSDLEFFLLNKLESSYLEDWRSSARTDIVKQFGGRNYPYYFPNRVSPFEQMRRSENLLISGPSGHSDNLSSR
jgi:pilus assembly protein CpaC